MKTRLIIIGILAYFLATSMALGENPGVKITLFIQNGEQIDFYSAPETIEKDEFSFDIRMVFQQVKAQEQNHQNLDIRPYIKPEKEVKEPEIDTYAIFQEIVGPEKAK